LVVFVGLIWLSALRSSVDGVTTSSGARNAIVALGACFSLAVIIRSLDLWTPRWLPWFGVVVTVGFLAVAALLFQSGNLDTAFAFYGGFQVPRAGRLFSDTHGLLSWFSCGFCAEWEAQYGPGLRALYPLTGGQIGLSWLPFLGLLFALIALLTIYLLGRSSTGLGRWVIAASAVSPAWLLLVERANWDVPIFGAVVVGAVLVAMRPTLVSWAALAFGIWVLGTIKIYPFALGVVLLLALGIRRGWTVVGGFLLASGVFALANFNSLVQSGGLHSSPELLAYEAGATPAYGRVLLSRQLEGFIPNAMVTWVTVALLLAIVGLAAWWGWLGHTEGVGQHTRVRLAVLSLAGATAFLAKTLVLGFGFAYTGVALLFVVPAILLQPRLRSLRNGSMVALGMLVIVAVFGAYNVLLGTLAGFVVSGFGLGFGLRVVWGIMQDHWKTHNSAIANV